MKAFKAVRCEDKWVDREFLALSVVKCSIGMDKFKYFDNGLSYFKHNFTSINKLRLLPIVIIIDSSVCNGGCDHMLSTTKEYRMLVFPWGAVGSSSPK